LIKEPDAKDDLPCFLGIVLHEITDLFERPKE
jgi:hypothetical protein